MDGFSIALGVLQLTGVAIKVSLLLHKKIKIFRNYSREVERLFKEFDRHQKNFVHEIHLLLRLANQDEADIKRMLDDAGDPQWSNQDLDVGLRTAFPRSLDTVQGIIEDIRSTLQTLQGELACFDEIARIGEKNDSLKDSVHHVRNKVKLTWNKRSLEEQINNFKDLYGYLRLQREQATEIEQPLLRGPGPVRRAHQLSREYGSISKVRRASKAFHQALTAAWLNNMSKTQLNDLRHTVKLKIDAEEQDEVTMEVVIACYGHSGLQSPATQIGFINLHVESRTLDYIESGLSTPSECVHDGSRKKRKICLNLDANREESTITSTATETRNPGPSNLQATQDICTALQVTSADPYNSKCLGYLDSSCNGKFRHSFFGMTTTRPISESICISTQEILSRPAEGSVTFVDQLMLARSFAMAVLKFHSTPWLGEYVSIRELEFFRYDDSDLSSYIRTAHLGSDFVQHPRCENFSIPTEDMGESEAIEDAKLDHGIPNLTLWSLGTVMLQIGMWSTLECTDDVLAVRRLAKKVPILGKRYKYLTEKCLYCNFAVGYDLSKPRLEQAVYEHVVCGLTEMIKALDIEDD